MSGNARAASAYLKVGNATARTIVATGIDRTKWAVPCRPVQVGAGRRNSNVITDSAYRNTGNATRKTIAATDQTKRTPLAVIIRISRN